MLTKKIIAAICSCTLLCSSIAFAAPEEGVGGSYELFATTFDGGDGTESNPYLISTETQLALVADVPNKCFKLTKDIELEKDWTPIGTYGDAFSGTFDGGGFTVSEMIVTDGDGFFKEVTGTVKNLHIEGSVTSSSQYAGGIAGKASGTFENCSFSGEVKNTSTSTGSYIGGMIGYYSGNEISECHTNGLVTGNGITGGMIGYYNSNSDSAISNSYSDCTVTGYDTGGLIGVGSPTITGCNAKGNVYGVRYVGGLIGYSSAKIKKCYATGDVSTNYESETDSCGGGLIGISRGGDIRLSFATGNVLMTKNDEGTYQFKYGGGFIGDAYVYHNTLTITNCYSRGNVIASTNSGGFIGGCDYNYNNGTYSITDCYSTGVANSGLIAVASHTSVTNSYYDSQTSGCNDANYGVPKSTSGMKNQITYENWDFEDIWAIDEAALINDGYPYLQWAFDSSVKLIGITLDQTNADIKMGSTLTLTATPKGENVDDIPLTWTSSDKNIATVNTNGVITAKNIGVAIITVYCGSISAECKINVLDNTVKVTNVSLDKSDAGVIVGETVVLEATVTPEDATNKDIKWTSTDTSVATVSNTGAVTGVAVGTTQIYATSVSNSACYAVCDITVAAERVAVTGIEFGDNLFNTPYEVNIGKSIVFSPTIKPSNATNKAVKWTSTDTSIATVANGKVTGVAEGTTTITATTVDGGYSASVIVKVTKPTVYVTGIALNTEQMTVDVKATKKLIAAVTPTDATDKTITFKSNNNAIANVTADGTVTGVSPGTTLIQAISDTSSGRFIAFCTVTVPKPVVEVTSVKLDKGSLEIVEGKTVPLKAIIKPTNATYKNITWSASDESIVTVSQDGYVTARGVGEAVVSATAVNGVNVICNITVLSSDTPAQLKVEDATVKAGKQIPVTVSIASNPGISTFNFDLTYDHTKMYPVSYTKGDALNKVNIVTPLGSQSFKERDSVRFLCSTSDSRNMDTDGDLITVVFQTLTDVEYGDYTIGIVPSAFTNQNYEAINLQEDNCTLKITDYIIGDVNNDDVVDLKDSMILGQYIAGFGVELTPQGKKAAVSIYPDNGDNVETSEPTINDFQHLFRYLADWQVELGKN